jgi:hypothetical protein
VGPAGVPTIIAAFFLNAASPGQMLTIDSKHLTLKSINEKAAAITTAIFVATDFFWASQTQR